LDGRYVIINDNTITFQTGEKYRPDLPLVIDPVLSYSTYLGGASVEIAQAVTVDMNGSIYVVGRTNSANFPVVNNYQPHQASYDCFVTKLNSDGSDPVYSTYLGGDSYDEAFDIEVDASGQAYLTGYTRSTNFPTLNYYQLDQATADGFVTKLGSGGDELIYSTYLGGSYDDYAYAIAVDDVGSAYVTGSTISFDFPNIDPYQTNQPYYDAFVSKFNADGDDLVYSTYLGGGHDDAGNDIVIDDAGQVFITGETLSDNFPTVAGYQGDQPGSDMFVAELNATGNDLLYGTYLGGNGDDYGYGLVLDNAGAVYIAGMTYSDNWPTVNPVQSYGGDADACVAVLNPDGQSLAFGTYLGGVLEDGANAIGIDASGHIGVTGYISDDNLTLVDALYTYQAYKDAFVVLFNGSYELTFSTYLGGDGDDVGNGIAFDTDNNIYAAGYTISTDFPIANPYQSEVSVADAFVSKFTVSTFICGDVDGDEQVNILDIVFLINYKYKAGPAPDPLQSADVNSDGDINILDIVYLINYKYKGGPAPDCP
jgi:hypothetical protein